MTERDGPLHPINGEESPAKFLKDCPVCQATFSEKHIRILAHSSKQRLVHATCDTCHHALLFLQVIAPGRSGVMGIVTDLSVNDVRRLMKAPHISEDDILSFHLALEDHTFVKHIVRATREFQN